MSNPNFPVTTVVVWSAEPVDEIKTFLKDQIPPLVAEGKTDGILNWPNQAPPFEAIRDWVDTDAATAWVAVVEANGGPTLVSVTIQP